METSGHHIGNFLVYRSEHTKSPNMLESDFKAIKCFRKAASKPVSKVHIPNAVLAEILKTKEANSLLHLGLEPEMVQRLVEKAYYKFGPENFVGVRYSTLYTIMFYGTARFEELKDLELWQISKKGTSFEIQIYKGNQNQTQKLQRCIIHRNSLEYTGNICLVKLID